MGRLSDFKKCGDFAAWDLDRGCRKIVNQESLPRRRLKKRLKRQERARINGNAQREVETE